MVVTRSAFAVIKLAEKEVGEHGDANGAVREYKTNNADMAEDGIKLPGRRWVPVGKLVAFGCSYVRRIIHAKGIHSGGSMWSRLCVLVWNTTSTSMVSSASMSPNQSMKTSVEMVHRYA